MSGLVGLFDPEGKDLALIERAAALGSAHRGSTVLRSFGGWTLGVLAGEDEEVDLYEQGTGVTIADARVDAALRGEASPAPGIRPQHLLATVMTGRGPEGLVNVAGDYAVAHLDTETGDLTLARDAFGLRPLFWAARDGRKGFASDMETLIALGLADGSLDVEALRRTLFEQGEYGDRTTFLGIRRVVAGTWTQLRVDGSTRGGRWFRPESTVPDPGMDLREAGALTREAIISAVVDRARGARVALFLSAGRDSSSIAVALAEAGVRAMCFTYGFDVPGVPSEVPQARELALSLGHEWHEVSVQPGIEPGRASEFAALAGKPVRGVGAPIQLAMYDTLRAFSPDVVMSGEGGDLLFSAFPIGILDLLRRGKVRRALATARSFDRDWAYGYRFVSKVLLRGVAPSWLLEARERWRPRAPWLYPPDRIRVRSDRSDRAYLLNLMCEGADATEAPERLFRKAGATAVWPLVDLRVVDVALRFPVELRLPYPAPKQVLDEALLGDRSRTLSKVASTGSLESLLRSYRADFPGAYRAGSLAASAGLVRPEGLSEAGGPRWVWQAADLAGLEMWLRSLEERDDD